MNNPNEKVSTKKSPIRTWLEIRKKLNQCSETDLKGIIGELYALSKSNKNFLDARFLTDNTVLERYEADIQKYISPYEPWKSTQHVSIKDAKKILSDYKKATSDKMGLIHLMIHYVECATHFLCEFGDMYMQYYNSLLSVFENALTLMKTYPDEDVQNFVDRMRSICAQASGMGWGYSDGITDMLRKAYPTQKVIRGIP
jgi:hypothetical protein